LNTNTNKVIDTTSPLGPNLIPKLDSTEVGFSGIPGKASQTVLDFINPDEAKTAGFSLQEIQHICQSDAKVMGLDPKSKAQPKIAILGVPSHKETPDGIQVDIDIQALSMGVLHRRVQ